VGETVRCPWVDLSKPLYVEYHDTEWGVPVRDDRRMFEFLLLEGAQAGLSWYTVLSKRENYRAAFDGFDPERIARYDRRRVEKLMANPGIIRNRPKIEAAIGNARAWLALQDELGSFSDYLWGFVGGRPIQHRLRSHADYKPTSPESDALSKDLKKRGFRFVGSTIVYAHMQATGMVNDHVTGCFRHAPLSDARG
jgi:DNA-3-methyladenine glycosylase I